MLAREDYIFMAKTANKVGRFQDMLEYMRKVSNMEQVLSAEERNLLQIAYKKCISAKREALKLIVPIKKKEESKPNPKLQVIKEVKDGIEDELLKLCNEAINFVENIQNTKNLDTESKVYFLKMQGDFHRYILEFVASENLKKSNRDELVKAYEAATGYADDLKPTHPLRLNVALNYAVYYFEIEKKTQDACNLAMAAFDEAIQEMDKLDEATYQDTMNMMQLIRDNVSSWTSDGIEVHESES